MSNGIYHAKEAEERTRQRYTRRIPKLVTHTVLCDYVYSMLRLLCSPNQIAQRLERTFPHEEETLSVKRNDIQPYIWFAEKIVKKRADRIAPVSS